MDRGTRAATEGSPFPLDAWGVVRSDPKIARVRVERARGGWLLITEENGQTFDVWLETRADVEASLDGLDVAWPTES